MKSFRFIYVTYIDTYTGRIYYFYVVYIDTFTKKYFYFIVTVNCIYVFSVIEQVHSNLYLI